MTKHTDTKAQRIKTLLTNYSQLGKKDIPEGRRIRRRLRRLKYSLKGRKAR